MDWLRGGYITGGWRFNVYQPAHQGPWEVLLVQAQYFAAYEWIRFCLVSSLSSHRTVISVSKVSGELVCVGVLVLIIRQYL